MGLDMYAFKCKKENKPDNLEVDFDIPQEHIEEIHYWRKHPNLHGWMEKLYRMKKGAAEEFNVVNLQLTDEDLDVLATAIINKELPDTKGFFFGDSRGDESSDDLKFVAEAKVAISEGYIVFYCPWW